MDIAALVTLIIGFALFPVALFWVYREAGAISNKFAIFFSVATIISLLPIVFMASSEDLSTMLTAPAGETGIPPFTLIFAAEALVVFVILVWRWYRLLRKVHSFKSQARELQKNVNAAAQRLEIISTEIEEKNKIIQTVNNNITNRYLELEEIRKTPR